MTRRRRGDRSRGPTLLLLPAGILGLGLFACEDALLLEPATLETTSISVAYNVSGGEGPARAFEKTERVRIELRREGVPVLDTTLALESSGSGRSVRLDVELSGVEVQMSAVLEMLSGAASLFRGDAAFTARPGLTTVVEINLTPIVAGVVVPEPVIVISALNETVTLAASAVFATGDPIPGAPLQWSSLDPEVAEVDAGGIVVSRGEGDARVVVSSPPFSETILVRVQPEVDVVQVEPEAVELGAGQRSRLGAVVMDRNGNVLPNRPVSWSSSDPTVAVVDSDGQVTGVQVGTTAILAESGGKVGSAAVTVTVPDVVTIRVSPGTLALRVGGSGQLTANAFDASGTLVPGAPVTWSSLDDGVASVTGDGVVTGVSPGVAIIEARSGDAVDAAAVTVGAPEITTSSLPGGTVGASYGAELAATGGQTPYTWSLSAGALPSGLGLEASSGAITGTPADTGTSSFTVRVTGGNGLWSEQGFSITVGGGTEGPGGPTVPPGAPSITTSSLPGGTVGASYGAELAATGGQTPYTWSLSAGALPAGLGLGTQSGAITGTPMTAGTSSFTVRVTGGDGLSSERSFSVTIEEEGAPPPPPPPPPPPSAPIDLIRDVTRIDGQNHFRLRWTNVGSDRTRLEVERRTTGDFLLIATLPADSTQFTEPVVEGHPRYRIRACNAARCSEWVLD
jgi:hypothetical protein